MTGNIYLVGLMGAGKTTVGRRLATILGRDFVDLDQALEERTGVSIAHIFEVEGEKGFRNRETAMLREASQIGDNVISTGGGVVMREENRNVMAQSGQVIYLRASFELLWHRLKDCQKRPLLQTENPAQKIKDLLAERDSVYAEAANIIVDVNSESSKKMARKIETLLRKNENH